MQVIEGPRKAWGVNLFNRIYDIGSSLLEDSIYYQMKSPAQLDSGPPLARG